MSSASFFSASSGVRSSTKTIPAESIMQVCPKPSQIERGGVGSQDISFIFIGK